VCRLVVFMGAGMSRMMEGLEVGEEGISSAVAITEGDFMEATGV
jgi:hypothetical protein